MSENNLNWDERGALSHLLEEVFDDICWDGDHESYYLYTGTRIINFDDGQYNDLKTAKKKLDGTLCFYDKDLPVAR